MPKLRLGVALLLPAPTAAEVDGLRRALGDGALERIPAHITLVPPVNVNTERLPEALAVLRKAAGDTKRFRVSVGPPATFLPDTPVIHLPVHEGEAELTALRERVFRPPLARPLTWPFVPHVTLADEAPPDRITAALTALADYRAQMTFERVHLLQESKARFWEPIADAAFEAPAVVGRGGLPVELSVTTSVDPEARRLVRRGEPLVVTARRDGEIVGVATGWSDGDAFRIEAVVLASGEDLLGTDEHLRAAFRSEAARRQQELSVEGDR